MAGIRGNTGWLMAQKQSALGTLATPALPGVAIGAFKTPLTGGGIAPVRSVSELSETDSNRDIGVSYVVSNEVQGSPEFYARDDQVGFWLQALLGNDSVTGAGPNYTHVLTPANTIPYLSVWRDVGDTLWESFQDCKVSSLTISGQVGQPLSVTPTILGRIATRLTSDPSVSASIPLASGYVYNENDATIQLSGGTTTLVGQFSITIENGVTTQYTDNVQPIDVVEGLRRVSGSFDLVFQNLTEYNSFFYGGASGTTVSNSIYTTSADFKVAKGSNNSIEFALPSIAYEAYPIDVNPAGNPIVSSITFVSQRGGSPVVTATVKNQVQLY
jgi:hypothetical protein